MRKIVLFICLMHSLSTFSGSFGSVVFNELMVDPEPAVGLPEVEYVELFNRSGRALILNDWTFHYGEKSYAFPDCFIDSAGYCLLCPRTSQSELFNTKSVLVFPTFPTLVNSGKSMYLVNEKQELVTYLEYSQNWYENAFKAKGGWSLECVDADNLSGQASNWTSSHDLNGGTPGFRNSVAAVKPDLDLPFCNGVYVSSPQKLEITFTKNMQPDNLSSVSNYQITPPITMISSVSTHFPDYRSVQIQLSDSLIAGTVYNLNLTNLKDVSMHSLKEMSISFGLPEYPETADLSLNEVLFNPLPGGCDYVEFVNVSNKCVDLSQVWLAVKSGSGVLSEGIRLSEKPLPCVPGSYWLLSAHVDTVISVNGCSTIPHYIDLASFPSMPDASGYVALLTTSAQVIDEFVYNEKMHFPLISNSDGVSLEKLNPGLPSANPESWASASFVSGYGTPGFQNSQFRELPEVKSEVFKVENKWMTPNNDGVEDLITISYHVPESGMASLVVYDLAGRIVRNLIQCELLAAEGAFFWDGTADDGRVVPAGRYILHVDYFSPSGKRNKKRFVLAVLF